MIEIVTENSILRFNIKYWTVYNTKENLLLIERKKFLFEQVRNITINKNRIVEWRICNEQRDFDHYDNHGNCAMDSN